MTRLAAGALAILLAAACGDAPSKSAPPGTAPSNVVDWGWPSVAASKGDSRFQLTAILRVAPHTPGGESLLQVQGRVELDDPNTLLSGLHGTIRAKGQDGKALLSNHLRPMVHAKFRSISFVGTDDDPAATRLQELEIGVRLIHVESWHTRTVTAAKPGKAHQVILPPFEFTVTPEETNLVVAAYATAKTWSANKPLGQVLGHRWAAESVSMVDANGEQLGAMGGGGSGGTTTSSYRNASTGNSMSAVAYPVSVTIRVPDAWRDQLVRYRFVDVDLSSVPAPR